LEEAQYLLEKWRIHDNHYRPHNTLGYKPPTPEAWLMPALADPILTQLQKTLTPKMVQSIGAGHNQGLEIYNLSLFLSTIFISTSLFLIQHPFFDH